MNKEINNMHIPVTEASSWWDMCVVSGPHFFSEKHSIKSQIRTNGACNKCLTKQQWGPNRCLHFILTEHDIYNEFKIHKQIFVNNFAAFAPNAASSYSDMHILNVY